MTILKYMCFFIFTANVIFPQEKLSVENGLSQNTVNVVLQDSKGYLWIGTNNGLNKYDGVKFHNYFSQINDTTSLSSNNINHIFEDSEKYLWISTRFGLNRFNTITNEVERIFFDDKNVVNNNFIRCVIQDKNGVFWIGTYGSGIIRYSHKEKIYKFYSNDPDSSGDSSFDYINEVFIDDKNQIWIGTFGGFVLFDSEKEIFHNYMNKKSPTYLLDKKIFEVFKQNENTFWLGTQNGIRVFDILSRKFLKTKTISNIPALKEVTISRIIKINDNEFWISTTSKGIFVYDESSRKISEKKFKETFSNIKFVSLLYKDYSNLIWAGTQADGLLKFNTSQKKFDLINKSNSNLPDENILEVFKDSKNNLWFGTAGGLVLKSKDKSKFQVFTNNESGSNSLSNNVVTDVIEDTLGNIWVATSEGLNRLNVENGDFKVYKGEKGNPKTLQSSSISELYLDKLGNLLVGTFLEGFSKYDFKKDNFTSFNVAKDSDSTLLGYHVRCFAEDDLGNLWIGTMRGLSKLNLSTGRFQHFRIDLNNPGSISSNSILTLHADKDNNVWIGTFGGGLVKLNQSENEFEYFFNSSLVDRNIIYSIVPENDSTFWLSTSNGIVEFNRFTNEIKNYGIDDGLQALEFNPGVGYKDKDGTIYFGGPNGLNILKENNNESKSEDVKMSFNSVKVNGEEYRSKIKNNKLQLRHSENNFLFEFTVLDFVNPANNNYAFKMKGIDEQINYSGNRNYTSYLGVPPGEYEFIVSGSNSNNIWNHDAMRLTIEILPPFYRATWFYFLIVVCLIVLFYAIHKFILYQQLEKQKSIEKVRLNAANDFHDHLGHSLTRISLYSSMLKKSIKANRENANELVESINDSAKSLFVDAKDFIWSLDPGNDSVYDLAVYLKDFGEDFFNKTNISFNSDEIPEELEKIKYEMEIKREIIFIFKEVMNNALKHSKAENVFLSFKLNDKDFVINFSDDGIGLRAIENKGRGIKSIKSRAEKINAELEIESVHGKKTTVKLIK